MKRHIRRPLLWRPLLWSTLLVMQPACQTQQKKTPQDPASRSTVPHAPPPPNSTLDDASRAHMGSQEAQFVQQAEKMIGASQKYVQNTTDPTGDLAGAAGEIAQKDPEILGAVLATPDLEGALTDAEGLANESTTLIPDSELPAEWLDEHEAGGGPKKITKEMVLGSVLLAGGIGFVVAGCLVGEGWVQTSSWAIENEVAVQKYDIEKKSHLALGHQALTPARRLAIGGGLAAGLAGAGLLWSATRKSEGSALAQGTQNTKDPARETYLADLNAVAAEVTRLYAARGKEAGLQLANNCAGAVRIAQETPEVRAQRAARDAEIRAKLKERTEAELEKMHRDVAKVKEGDVVAEFKHKKYAPKILDAASFADLQKSHRIEENVFVSWGQGTSAFQVTRIESNGVKKIVAETELYYSITPDQIATLKLLTIIPLPAAK